MSASLQWARSDQTFCNTSKHTHTRTQLHTQLSYSVIHTPLWQHEHTLFIHTHTSPKLNTHTPLWQIWHPPPVVTFLQPPPPSMGAIPVTVGCARCGKVLKSRRLFPVNLVSLLCKCFEEKFADMVRHNSSQRAAVGGAGTRRRKPETCQSTGHRSRLPHVTVCLNYFHIFWNCTSLSQNIKNHKQKHVALLRRHVCCFFPPQR